MLQENIFFERNFPSPGLYLTFFHMVSELLQEDNAMPICLNCKAHVKETQPNFYIFKFYYS